MTPHEFRANLKLAQIPIEDVARKAGVAGATVHRVIGGQGRSKRAEVAIAEALGTTRESLFGPNQREMRHCTPESAVGSS